MSDKVITLGGFNRKAWAGWLVGLTAAVGGGVLLYYLIKKGKAGKALPPTVSQWTVSEALPTEVVEPITAQLTDEGAEPLALDDLDPGAREAFLGHYGSLGDGISIYAWNNMYFVADFATLEYRMIENLATSVG